MRRTLAIAGFAVFIGCAEPASVPRAPPAVPPVPPGPLVRLQAAGTWGELTIAVLSIGNGGSRPILIRSIELPGQLPEARVWAGPAPGRILAQRREGVLVWRFRDPGLTSRPFAYGLLYPGEAITIERPLRLRSNRQEVVLLYQEVDPWVEGTAVYLPWHKGTHAGRRDIELLFARGRPGIESAYRRLRPGSPERAVIVEGLERWPVVRRTFVESVAVRGLEESAPLLAELGHPGAELSRSDLLDAWLVREPARGGILRYPQKGGEGELLPALDFTVFDLADLAARNGEALWVESLESGALEGISPSDVAAYLRLAARRGLRVAVAPADLEDGSRILHLALR